jgi:hypothetical protein
VKVVLILTAAAWRFAILRVDVWHWKAARFNPMGFTDDKFWDDVTRRSDGGSGSGASNGGALPDFMAASDPGANVTFLAEDQAARNSFDPFRVQPGSVDVKTAFNAAGFTAGDRIAGRILAIPSGNRASVRTAGSWFGGTWTVEFARKIAGETGTDGNTEDFTVVRGGSVKFANEIFDNVADHANHIGAPGGSGPADTLQAYTINFPAGNTVLMAHFINGNTDAFRSRVYLWNPSAGAGNITVEVYTMPRPAPSDPPEASQLLGTLSLGTVEAQSARAIRIEEVLAEPEIVIALPYLENGGNLTFKFTIEADGVRGSAQVFSSDLSLAFGTYPLQVVE